MTPEYLSNTGTELQYPFTKLTKEIRIGLVAIDEAYLVRAGVHSGTFNWSCKSAKVRVTHLAKNLGLFLVK